MPPFFVKPATSDSFRLFEGRLTIIGYPPNKSITPPALKEGEIGTAYSSPNDSAKAIGTFKLANTATPSSFKQVSKKEQQVIFNKVCRLMDATPAFTPAKLNGKKVIANYNGYTYQSAWNDFKIKDHKIYVKDKDGQYKEL